MFLFVNVPSIFLYNEKTVPPSDSSLNDEVSSIVTKSEYCLLFVLKKRILILCQNTLEKNEKNKKYKFKLFDKKIIKI